MKGAAVSIKIPNSRSRRGWSIWSRRLAIAASRRSSVSGEALHHVVHASDPRGIVIELVGTLRSSGSFFSKVSRSSSGCRLSSVVFGSFTSALPSAHAGGAIGCGGSSRELESSGRLPLGLGSAGGARMRS